MELNEILPSDSKFHLSSLKKDIFLSPPTLGTHIDFEKKYNAKFETFIGSAADLDNIIIAAYNLMTPESKRLFKIREVSEVDDFGNETLIKIGGIELFKRVIVADEFSHIYLAIVEACKYPPSLIEGLKKKILEAEIQNGN